MVDYASEVLNPAVDDRCAIVPLMNPSAALPFGTQLREWRQRRRLSQLDLSVDAEVSTRHLSFVETGRAMPSREMVLRLADRLEVPLRERNRLLTAAGFAPMYAERPLDDPALAAARDAVERILKAHEPFPALAVDRHWNLMFHNAAAAALLRMGVASELLQPPVNVLRVSLHPHGLAPRIVNLAAAASVFRPSIASFISVNGLYGASSTPSGATASINAASASEIRPSCLP